MIGVIPAARQALANRTDPYMPSRSVSPSRVMPYPAARATRSLGCEAPYCIE